MLQGLPLFQTTEWGTVRQEGWKCFTCNQGRLETHDTRLRCSHCGEWSDQGWRRGVYGLVEQPRFLKGQDVQQGPLYQSLQHYVSPPTTERPLQLADFVLDIDRDNLTQAVEATCAYLDVLWGLGAKPVTYFSGKKGFHIVTPWQQLGASPRYGLNEEVYGRLALKLQSLSGHSHCRRIYSRARLLRVPDRPHGDTGAFKVWLGPGELAHSFDYAAKPRGNPPEVQFSLVPGLHDLYLEAQYAQEKEPKTDLVRIQEAIPLGQHPACITRALEEGPPAGERHRLSVNLAAYIVRTGADPELLLDWARHNPGTSDTPSGDRLREAQSDLRWAQRKNPDFYCRTMQDLGFCNPTCPLKLEEETS